MPYNRKTLNKAERNYVTQQVIMRILELFYTYL
jgi:hypothetical protein